MPIARSADVPVEAAPFGEGLRSGWVHHGEHASTAVVRLAAGGSLPAHYHREHDEVITILEGVLEFRLGEERQRLAAGNVAHVPAGTVHGITRAETDCIFVAVFGPRFDLAAPDRHFLAEDKRS